MGLQKKTIAEYLSKRTQYWAFSFRNEKALTAILNLSKDSKDTWTEDDQAKVKKFRSDIITNTIATGGAIASMLLGEEINDVDLYIADKDIARQIAWYYLHLMMVEGELKDTWCQQLDVKDNPDGGVAVFVKSQGAVVDETKAAEYQYFEALSDNAIDEFFDEYRKAVSKKDKEGTHAVRFLTSNAITLWNGIQIVLRFCGAADEIHKNYDFVHATNYWTQQTGLVYHEAALQALLEKRLVYVGSRFPVCSMFRLRKFIQRGYRVSAGEMTKIAYDISKLDLDDSRVLHDQLIGVDYAFFYQVLALLRERQSIDRTYLFQILDQVFTDEHADQMPEINVKEHLDE